MEPWLWVGFFLLIAMLLFLDLGFFHRRSQEIQAKDTLIWTCFWIGLALLFNVAVYYLYEFRHLTLPTATPLSGREAALQFFTSYLLEKSLSLDNIFVIAMIFSYFRVPLKYQHRVLFWGILGVLILRFLMIMIGIALLREFSWMNYLFGSFLIYTSVKMLVAQEENIDPKKNFLVALAYRWKLVSEEFDGDRFITKVGGRYLLTPLFLVLCIVESSDLLFAIDSIPAVFAVTSDPFIVYTSNIFAILGLRSLYFFLAALVEKFIYIKTSLVFILAFIGVKMLAVHYYEIPTLLSLWIILGILGVGFIASFLPSVGKKP